MTLDGVLKGGERIAAEVMHVFEGKRGKVSFIGHSLGGVYARYAIGLLENCGFFEENEPINYVSIVSPHSGVGSTFPWVFEHIKATALSFAGETLKQLALRDNDQELPLLVQMARTNSPFMLGLQKFDQRIAYANAQNDFVFFDTAALQLPTDPTFYTKKKDGIIIQYSDLPSLTLSEIPKNLPLTPTDHNKISFIRKNLRTLLWKRVVVSISKGNAHTQIIVRRELSENPGFEVLDHLRDNLKW